MAVEVRQVVKDLLFFENALKGIRFMKTDKSWYVGFPTIANWSKGDIVLEIRGDVAKDVVDCLAAYGAQAEIVNIDGGTKNGVKFAATVADDVIFVLHKAICDKNRKDKISTLEHEMSGLTQNVDQLIQQLPNVQRGVFSRGVNAMKNQVEVLQNLRNAQNKKGSR